MTRLLNPLLYQAAVLMVCCLAIASSTQAQINTQNLARVGVLRAEGGNAFGSCFVCDERGYVATCMSNVLDAREVNVHFDAHTRLRVAGFVAASRGLDVVILQLANIPTDDPRFKRALDLKSNYVPKVDDQLWPYIPGGLAPVATGKLPQLVQVMRGDEFCAGLRSLPAVGMGCRSDTCWMWLDRTFSMSSNGGPVFNQDGQVVGMMSYGPSRQDELFSALHIKHVEDLLPRDDPKPKSIKLLKNWIDPLPTTETITKPMPAEVTSLESSLSSDLYFSGPLIDRVSYVSTGNDRLVNEKVSLDQKIVEQRRQIDEARKQINDLNMQIQEIRPEEPHEKKETDSKGKTVRTTEYEYSRRQRDQIKSLKAIISNLETQIKLTSSQLHYESAIMIPFVSEAIANLPDKAFFNADPLGTRSTSDHEAFETALTAVIEKGGAKATDHLARGMTRIHLRKLKDAQADLKVAYGNEPRFRSLCNALNARIARLETPPDKNDNSYKSILKDHKTDPKLLLVMARIELDGQNIAPAMRYVQQAHELRPEDPNVQLALAWLLSQSNTNSKLALESASRVVTRTGYRDWNSLAALANVHMMMRKKDLAAQAIRLAVAVAPPSAKALCTTWQTEIDHDKIIQRDWKALP